MTAELFERHGAPFTGTPLLTEKGRPYIMRRSSCWRCGGAGGAERWRHTGWTCFQCGGSGKSEPKMVRLYTAAEVAKLTAAAEKRAAKKAAAAAEAAAAAKAEAEARREAFMAEHGALLERAEPFKVTSEFIASVLRKAAERCELTPAQVEALEKTIARLKAIEVQKAASEHVGKIGERLVLEVRAERVTAIETQYGVMRIATMRSSAGAAIVSKGRFLPPTATWSEERERWECSPESFWLVATVKAHETYREEKQTVVQRCTTKGG